MRYRDQVEDEDDDGVLDLSIVGDEEEQHRIELEHNLQDLSIQLSLSNPSQASDQERSGELRSRKTQQSDSSFELEYPRHNSRPRDISIFHGRNSSFLDNTQQEHDFNPHHYSYRSMDDEDGVHYMGNTMSTVAHHASAVTLSAGLGGRGNKRGYVGEASLSGAEYDPDRPLDSVLNGVANDLSMLNMDNSGVQGKRRGRNAPVQHAQVTFDPVIVDHDTSAFGGTRRSFTNARNSKQAQATTASYSDREPAPKCKSRVKRSTLNLNPPTPSTVANATSGSNATTGSKFTRLAKTLAREIEASQRWTTAPEIEEKPSTKPLRKTQSLHRSPFQDVVNHSFASPPPPPKAKAPSKGPTQAAKGAGFRFNDMSKHELSHSKIVNLPDVTGLTSVLGSPPRKNQEWRTYVSSEGGEHAEVELLKTLTTLQTRLNQLESQNLVSRRRVRELELELETCKLEVKRERTRVLEREEIIVAQQKDFQRRRSATSKLPERMAPDPVNESRYSEVVEEKKALEALIATLRSHLSRLTDELSNQQTQLDELRALRDCDLRNLRDKISEVDALRLEVERLGGEVEILRGVVEEGLNERRRAKESMDSLNISMGSIIQAPHTQGGKRLEQNDAANDPSQAEFPSPPPSRPPSRQERYPNIRSKAALPNAAVAGPSRNNVPVDRHFIDAEELDRVSAEVECRSERSEPDQSQYVDTSELPGFCPADRQEVQHNLRSRVRPTRGNEPHRVRMVDQESPRPSRPYVKTPARPSKTQTVEVATPFPQIRGKHLERLFFSAPEHNEKTCRVCHRHRRPGASDDELDFPSWLPPRKRTKTGREDGCSRYEDPKPEDNNDDNNIPDRDLKTSNKAPFSEDRLPPQTVLVRVLRELEDDFTHYKGIYIELADQYKIIDAASNVPKRNVLAEHLKEVITILEQKGDQIASLYDLLTFKDKPIAASVVPDKKRGTRAPRSPRSPRSPRKTGSRRLGGLRKYATYS